MSLGARIRKKRIAKGMSQQALGDVFGITRSSVNEWESGRTRPDPAKLVELARVLGIDLNELLTESDGKESVIPESKSSTQRTVISENVTATAEPVGRLPVISWIQAGVWDKKMREQQLEGAEERVPCPFPDSDFVLRVAGDSMFNPGGEWSFRDGEFISVSTTLDATHRGFVIAKRVTEKAATFRQLLIENDGTHVLHALNPAWPERYTPVDAQMRIIGVVTGQWRAL
ncbi:MAG: XRE family transcriptional regulator [Burkholderia sp.]